MTPWQAIFTEASEASLRAIARDLGLAPGPDRETLTRSIQGAARASTRFLLERLDLDELRAVSRACGLLSGGARPALLERLERRAAFETGLPRRRPTRRRSARSARLATMASSAHPPYRGEPFVAIDFETADRGRDSACAMALVRVEGGALVRSEARRIRPPRRPRPPATDEFEFTHIHGLRWRDVRDEPPFPEVWAQLEELLDGAAFMVAHNAPFDRGVLEACCRAAGVAAPDLPWRCTLNLSRARWRLSRHRLSDVAAHLGLELDHHDALSDAQACARILLAGADPDLSG